MEAVAEKNLQQPIEYYYGKYSEAPIHDTGERFGLKFTPGDYVPLTEHTTSDNFSVLRISSCTYAQLYERILNTPSPDTGHFRLPNTYDYMDDEEKQEDIDFDSLMPTGDTLTEDQSTIPVSTLKQILIRAVSWFFVHKSLKSISETSSLCIDQIPFMISTLSDLSNSIMGATEQEESALERLDTLLKSWKFSRFEVQRDGNCLFVSVAHNIKSQLESGNTDLQVIINNLGINSQLSLLHIASTLRRGEVKEWLGDHSKAYQSFMTEGQLQIQAEEFLQDGVFSSDIGDLVIAALSNMLQTPLILFTSRLNQPIHIQNPTYSQMRSSTPIYLAYLHIGPGHYDAVVCMKQNQDTTVTDSTPSSSPSCTCGRKSTKANACSFSLDQYTCRCPCYNGKRPCTPHCKCRGCTNSFGTKAEAAAKAPKPGQKRKRVAYESQMVPLRGRRGMKFMKAVGEPIGTGGFSSMEFLVICSIIQCLMADDFDWKHSEDLTSEDVLFVYNCILELVQTLQVNLALFKRTSKDILKLMKKTTFKWDIYSQKSMIL